MVRRQLLQFALRYADLTLGRSTSFTEISRIFADGRVLVAPPVAEKGRSALGLSHEGGSLSGLAPGLFALVADGAVRLFEHLFLGCQAPWLPNADARRSHRSQFPPTDA